MATGILHGSGGPPSPLLGLVPPLWVRHSFPAVLSSFHLPRALPRALHVHALDCARSRPPHSLAPTPHSHASFFSSLVHTAPFRRSFRLHRSASLAWPAPFRVRSRAALLPPLTPSRALLRTGPARWPLLLTRLLLSPVSGPLGFWVGLGAFSAWLWAFALSSPAFAPRRSLLARVPFVLARSTLSLFPSPSTLR